MTSKESGTQERHSLNTQWTLFTLACSAGGERRGRGEEGRGEGGEGREEEEERGRGGEGEDRDDVRREQGPKGEEKILY